MYLVFWLHNWLTAIAAVHVQSVGGFHKLNALTPLAFNADVVGHTPGEVC